MNCTKQPHTQKQKRNKERTEANKIKAKDYVPKAYKNNQEECITDKIYLFEKAHTNYTARLTWSIVTEVSEKKDKPVMYQRNNSNRAYQFMFNIYLDSHKSAMAFQQKKVLDVLPIDTKQFAMKDFRPEQIYSKTTTNCWMPWHSSRGAENKLVQ